MADLEPTREELQVAASMSVSKEQLIKQKAKDSMAELQGRVAALELIERFSLTNQGG